MDGVFNRICYGVFSFDLVAGVVDGAFNLDAGVLMSLDDGAYLGPSKLSTTKRGPSIEKLLKVRRCF